MQKKHSIGFIANTPSVLMNTNLNQCRIDGCKNKKTHKMFAYWGKDFIEGFICEEHATKLNKYDCIKFKISKI